MSIWFKSIKYANTIYVANAMSDLGLHANGILMLSQTLENGLFSTVINSENEQ